MVDAPARNQDEKRLIILLPSALLEELRQAAEELDLSVSQIVRRAIRNELKSIAYQKSTTGSENAFEMLQRLLAAAQRDRLSSGVAVSGAAWEAEEKKRKLANQTKTRARK
jgi:Ribbon-helix-helix protein, copG family